jgi:hypothetical protein
MRRRPTSAIPDYPSGPEPFSADISLAFHDARLKGYDRAKAAA